MQVKKAIREVPSEGMHTAILYQIIDLGTQKIEFPGSEPQIKPRVLFQFELPEEKMADFRPFSISIEYTLSGSKKATLMQHLKSWVGNVDEKFQIESLLGKACNLNIGHNVSKSSGETYAKIISPPTPLKKGEAVPKQFNASKLFEMSPPDKFSVAAFSDLPEWFQNKIKLSPEYVEAVNWANGIRPEKKKVPIAADLNDEIPF